MVHVSEARLLRYLDGDLPDAVADQVASHLGDCARCRQILGEHLEIEQALSAMPALYPVPSRPRRKAARPPWLRVGVAAAALAATLGASWGLEVAGYWRAERDERAAMRRDHYALVSAEANLLREAEQQ